MAQIRRADQREVPTVEGPAFAPGKNPPMPPHPAEVRGRSQVPESSPTGLVYCRKTDGTWTPATPCETPREFAHRSGGSVEFDSSHPHSVRVQRHGVEEWDRESDPRGKVLRVKKSSAPSE